MAIASPVTSVNGGPAPVTGVGGPGSGSGPAAGSGPDPTAQAEAVADALSLVVAELDVDRLTGSDARALYTSMAAVERLATAGKTLLAPRIEKSGIWRDEGHRNAAGMLAELEGVPVGQARATLTNGNALSVLPGTEAVLRQGVLSGPKVNELTGAGVLDPDREADLVAQAAEAPLADVREKCRRSRATSATSDPLATFRRIRARRSFSSWTDAEGAFCFRGRDTADRGAKILAHIAAVADRLREAHRDDPAGAGSTGQDSTGQDSTAGDPSGQDPTGPGTPMTALRADALYALVTCRHPDTDLPLMADPPGSDGEGVPGRDGAGRDGAGRDGAGRGGAGRDGAGTERRSPSRSVPPRQSSSGPGPGSPPPTGSPSDPESDPESDLDPDVDPDVDIGPDSAIPAVGGHEEGPSGPSWDSLRLIDGPPTCSVVVRVDLEALLRGQAEEGEICEIDHQGPIPVATARQMANDSFLRLVFHRAGDIRAVSHMNRTINKVLRTALVYRDTTCVVPGCQVSWGLEIDHTIPVEEGGPTELDNLSLLCHHHHFLKTHEGWTLSRGPLDTRGRPTWTFVPPVPFGQEPGLGIDTPEARRAWHEVHGYGDDDGGSRNKDGARGGGGGGGRGG